MSRCEIGGTHTGARPDPSRKYQINYIQDYHREVMRLMVLGWTNKRIREHTGLSIATLSAIRNSDLTRRQIEFMHAARDHSTVSADKILDEASTEAALKLKMLLDTEGDNRLVKDVAIAILDRSDHGPTHRVKGEVTHSVFGEDDLLKLRNRFKQAIDDGVTDVDYEEVG